LLGELVACRERARKHDGIIKLVLNPKQRDFLVSTRVDQLFEIFRDEDEALDSFDAWTTTAGIP
jgi:anti-anti-sigma regulatory factor